jgi:hypothetical protein
MKYRWVYILLLGMVLGWGLNDLRWWWFTPPRPKVIDLRLPPGWGEPADPKYTHVAWEELVEPSRRRVEELRDKIRKDAKVNAQGVPVD